MSAAISAVKDPPVSQASSVRWFGSALRLLAKGLALVAGAMAVMVAIVMFVPDGNDYALATLKKHRRLGVNVPVKKIVFVGGSNLAFGLDSALVQRQTGSHVVNMGMNGYFGVRYMLEEVKPFLRPSDVVVVSLEYDSFYKSVDGTPNNLLLIVKANPAAFSYLSWKQRWEVTESVPYVAQQKVLRLTRVAGGSVSRLLFPKPETANIDAEGARGSELFRIINAIETLKGFDENGDLTSHFGLAWQYEREDGIDLTKTPRDSEVIGLLRDFGKEMKSRDVGVIVSYTPAIDYYYRRHQASIDELHSLLGQAPELIVPRPPAAHVYPEPLFFDTVYHLNVKGRALRTQKVIEELEAARPRADAFSGPAGR